MFEGEKFSEKLSKMGTIPASCPSYSTKVHAWHFSSGNEKPSTCKFAVASCIFVFTCRPNGAVMICIDCLRERRNVVRAEMNGVKVRRCSRAAAVYPRGPCRPVQDVGIGRRLLPMVYFIALVLALVRACFFEQYCYNRCLQTVAAYGIFHRHFKIRACFFKHWLFQVLADGNCLWYMLSAF